MVERTAKAGGVAGGEVEIECVAPTGRVRKIYLC